MVLLHADSPKHKKLSDSLQKQNDELKAKFGVRGFPTVVVMTADGKELGRMSGYKPGSGPEAWIEKAQPHVDKMAEHMWLTSFEEAKKLARKQRKPIMIDFNGSDW